MKSSLLPKYEQEIVKISALTTQNKIPGNFSFVFWEKRWLHKFILKLSDLYKGTSSRIVFVCFLEELKTPKWHFEINWPLLHLGSGVWLNFLSTRFSCLWLKLTTILIGLEQVMIEGCIIYSGSSFWVIRSNKSKF
jgi:hypothetical protein